MALFKINGSAVKKIIANDFDLEKSTRSLFEQNLEEILNIVFLAHEYSTSFGGRIDTLWYRQNGSPCIIEYKKTKMIMLSIKGFHICNGLTTKENLEILCQS